MNPFTYHAYQIMTWEPLGTLPYTNVTFGHSLNAVGSFSGQLVLTDPDVQSMGWQQATIPGATALFVDYLGRIVWGGMITGTNYTESSSPKALSVTAQTFHAWAQQRLQVYDYSTLWAYGEDPLQITLRFVTDAIGQSFSGIVPGCNIGGPGIQVVINGGPAPPAVVTYPGTSLQSIDSMMNTLSQMGYGAGFDYSWDCAWNGGMVPEVTLNLWYPRQGRTFGQDGLVIHRGNVIDWTYPEDSTQQSDSVFVVGSTTAATGGTVPVGGIAQSVIAEGWPLLEKAYSHVQINDEEVLIGVAEGLLGQSAYPVVTPTITLPIPLPNVSRFSSYPNALDPSMLTFGDFGLGDDVQFVIDPVIQAAANAPFGSVNYHDNCSPRFPEGMNFAFRITGWAATVPAKGIPTLLLDLAVPPFEAFPPPMAPH